jgi:pimeloyl-ACP methyl ester carboxylesterase
MRFIIDGMETTHHFIEVNGIRTHYLLAGEGPETIVLAHGGGLDSASLSWDLLIPDLAAVDGGNRFRVIAPDWPGFGETPILPGGISIAALQQFLVDFLDKMAIDRAAFAGISMGGASVLGFALEHPERVEKLILVDSYGLQRAAPMPQLSYLFVRLPGMRQLTWAMLRSRTAVRYSLRSLLKRPGTVTDDLVEQVYQQMIRPGVAKAFSDFQDSELTWNGLRTCYMDQLDALTMPVLIIHGDRDGLVPAKAAREAHAAIANSQLVWMEGSGHWPQRDDPQTFNQVVLNFLT